MSLTNFDVAHRFASGEFDHAEADNFYFRGNIIYSYGRHFPVAIKYAGRLLFNEHRYSVTTSKHQHDVLVACSHYDIVRCADLEEWNCWSDRPTEEFYKSNYHIWKSECEYLIKAMGKARKPEKYAAEILGVVAKVERFCEVFEQKLPDFFEELRSADGLDAVVEYAKEQEKKERAAAEERERKAVEEFLNFERDWFDGKYQIVRYRAEKNRFETSKSVEVPYEIGLEFYRKLRDGELVVGDKVLWYRVTAVGSEVRIGCHTFKKKWLLEYGKKMFNE